MPLPHHELRHTRRRWVRLSTATTAALSIALAAVWLAGQPEHSTPHDAWLAKVHDVRNEFPPGYAVTEPDPKLVTQNYLDALQQPMKGATSSPPNAPSNPAPPRRSPSVPRSKDCAVSSMIA